MQPSESAQIEQPSLTVGVSATLPTLTIWPDPVVVGGGMQHPSPHLHLVECQSPSCLQQHSPLMTAATSSCVHHACTRCCGGPTGRKKRPRIHQNSSSSESIEAIGAGTIDSTASLLATGKLLRVNYCC